MPRTAPKLVKGLFKEFRDARNRHDGGVDLRDLAVAITRRWGGFDNFADAMFKATEDPDFPKGAKVNIYQMLVRVVTDAWRLTRSETVDVEQMSDEDLEATVLDLLAKKESASA